MAGERSARGAVGATRRPLEDFCCVNPRCKDAGRKAGGNLAVRNGKGTPRWRILRCTTCKAEFSERKGTALWGTKMSPEKSLAIAEHLQEGCGIRGTARLTGTSTDGVTSIAVRLGLHAQALHNERARNLEVREVQLDEKWAFVGKKQKNCSPLAPEDQEKGDQWDHTAIAVESRFLVSMVTGKRGGDALAALAAVVGDFAERTGGSVPALITTDDCAAYAAPLMNQYGVTFVPPRTGKPGRPRGPYKEWPAGSVHATVKKTYRKDEVAKVSNTLVYGQPQALRNALAQSTCSQTTNTAFQERQNGTDRNFNPRKARKTYRFSKKLFAHLAIGLWVMLCYNFHHLHRSLRLRREDGTFVARTPAVVIGLAERPLSVADILAIQVVGFVPRSRATAADFPAAHIRGRAP